MNYRLSCASNRKARKNGYLIEVNGREVDSNVFKLVSDNIKENIVECVYRGLKAARNYVNHSDILCIEIQNSHLKEWLSGNKSYKGYEECMDKTFEVLESVDCKYRFVYVECPEMLRSLKDRDFDKEKVMGIEDAMIGLD